MSLQEDSTERSHCLCAHIEERPYEDTVGESSCLEVRKRTEQTGTLILDFQPPELWKNKFLFPKPLSLFCLSGSCRLIQTHGSLQERPEMRYPAGGSSPQMESSLDSRRQLVMCCLAPSTEPCLPLDSCFAHLVTGFITHQSLQEDQSL